MEEKVKSRWVWNESTQRHQRVEFKTGTYSYVISNFACTIFGKVKCTFFGNVKCTL